MCVIAHIPAGGPIPSMSDFAAMWRANPDGAGFMYPSHGRLITVKGLMSMSAFKEAFAHHRLHIAQPGDTGKAEVDVCVHFRIGTHGGHNAEMTHPHLIGPEAMNLALCHNGIMRRFTEQADPRYGAEKSDSAHFADFLHGLPPRWWASTRILTLLAEYIGEANKVVIYGKHGMLAILNQHSGALGEGGVWYSNDYWRTRRVTAASVFPLSIPASRERTTYQGLRRVEPNGSDIQAGDRYSVIEVRSSATNGLLIVHLKSATTDRIIRVDPDRFEAMSKGGKFAITLKPNHPPLRDIIAGVRQRIQEQEAIRAASANITEPQPSTNGHIPAVDAGAESEGVEQPSSDGGGADAY